LREATKQRHATAATRPSVSVIIPVRNGAAHLRSCLQALAQSISDFECIVVDDGSTDHSAEIAHESGAIVLTTGDMQGPAAARNLGAAAAKSDLLLFLDSDICVKPDSLTRVVQLFAAEPDVAAAFGSYDDTPAQQDFLSQYRNLMHHFVHQRSRRIAETFWSGFGAIRSAVFSAHGGFDTSFSHPSIEDIELGHRLYRSGCKIVLDPTIQVKHLKAWTFRGMLTTDVLYRAIPWTELILRNSDMPRDLNLGISQRISVALAFVLTGVAIVSSVMNATVFLAPLIGLLFLMSAQYEVELTVTRRFKGTVVTTLLIVFLGVASFWSDQPIIFVVSVLAFLLLLLRHHYYSPEFQSHKWVAKGAGGLLIAAVFFVAAQPGPHIFNLLLLAGGGILILLNARFYALLAAKRGRTYALAAIPFHLLFFLYSGIAFVIAVFRHMLLGIAHHLHLRTAQPDCRRSGTTG
jgi:GT2 family glycosyltransferase